MNTDELSIEVNSIKDNHDKCENRQKEEHDRLQDQLNEQKAKLETTKKGIYDEIEKMEKEGGIQLNKATLDLKEMIKKDITDPITTWKKWGIKIFFGFIGAAFVALFGFIQWLLGITNVINNLETLIGG